MPTRIFVIFCVFLLVLLQYQLWFSQDGVQKLWHLKKAIATQTQENKNLYQQNQDRQKHIAQLKNNPQNFEPLAREELGMIKSNEKYYQIIER